MKSLLKAAIFFYSFLFLNTSPLLATTKVDSLDATYFDRVYLYIPNEKPQSVIIMISGDGGWKYGVLNFANTFASMGSLVIGVDILHYYKNLRNRNLECYNVTADFVTLATNLEKKYQLAQYQPPLLMGYSSGATLVYALLAQARPGTFRGGISLGFCSDIKLPKPFCRVNGLEEEIAAKGDGFDLEPDLKLGNRWIVLNGKLDKTCDYQATFDFVKKTSDAELITLDNVGHGFSNEADFMPQWKQVYHSLLAMPMFAQKSDLSNAEAIKDLPTDITPTTTDCEDEPMALFLSGDGGWYSFEQRISDRMAMIGVPTVGVDTKRYFWNRRSPEETTRDISNLLNYYSNLWGKNEFMLIGYSMGAEVLPFIVNRLPSDQQAMIQSIVLLSPRPKGDFEIHFSSMLGLGSYSDSYDVKSEIEKMPQYCRKHTLLVFGDAENSDMPNLLRHSKLNFASLPGDHHYNNNSMAIMNLLQKKGIL